MSMWYLPVIDRLHALFGNPEYVKLMSWHALAEGIKMPSSPSSGPSDDDGGNGGDGNGGDGRASSPGHSPPPDMSNQQGGTGGAPGNKTPPPSGSKGTGQYPSVPKKPIAKDEAKPAHLTTEE